jgi:hypothetical protein
MNITIKMQIILFVIALLIVLFYVYQKYFEKYIFFKKKVSNSEIKKIKLLLSNGKISEQEAKELINTVSIASKRFTGENVDLIRRHVNVVAWVNLAYIIFDASGQLSFIFGDLSVYSENMLLNYWINAFYNQIFWILGIVFAIGLLKKRSGGRIGMAAIAVILVLSADIGGFFIGLYSLYVLWNICGENRYELLTISNGNKI